MDVDLIGKEQHEADSEPGEAGRQSIRISGRIRRSFLSQKFLLLGLLTL